MQLAPGEWIGDRLKNAAFDGRLLWDRARRLNEVVGLRPWSCRPFAGG